MVSLLKKITIGLIVWVSLINTGFCSVQQMIQTVLNKGQNALCLKNGIFRKSNGDQCKNPIIARLVIVTCKGVQDFDNSQCDTKAMRTLGYAGVATAKEDIIKTLPQDPTYKSFFCSSARSEFTGHLKEIADKCNAQSASTLNNTAQPKGNSEPITRNRSNAISKNTNQSQESSEPLTRKRSDAIVLR